MGKIYDEWRNDLDIGSKLAKLKAGLNPAMSVPKQLNRSELDYTGKVMYLDAKCPGIFDLNQTPEIL